MLKTVEFHFGNSEAFVRSAQIRSGLARMVVETPHSMRRVVLALVA
jgi:hypothetical protein